ncbi:MAG TPA: hypothetical protein VN031_01200 [Candidatus Microsaccharimonas sp.]|nr:hypothetical protein [Candidatus Microsaccharimonas sp.]
MLTKTNLAIARAVGVVAAVAIMVTGVTFAALQSQQAVLSGNMIQSASANLLIGTASATSSEFSSSHSGFTFTDIVPGGPAVPATSSLYLKNTGTATLSVKLSVGATPTNTSNVDLSKVMLRITRVDTDTTQSASLQALIDGGLSLTDTLAPASTGIEYTLSASMTDDAFTGSSAAIGAIDLVFSGTATH